MEVKTKRVIMNRLIKKIKISAQLELISGLHIGDSKENVEIGGVDNGIIRRKDNFEPYIPGSSLKGKIRSLLEQNAGENADGKFKDKGSPISKLFGSTENRNGREIVGKGNASRIIVRDAYLNSDSVDKMNDSEFMDLPYSEIKFENTINRILGKADNPRQQERVPAGAIFEVELIVNIFENDNQEELLYTLKKGIQLLELDYLGGSGSRGYGQVVFLDWVEQEINLDEISV